MCTLFTGLLKVLRYSPTQAHIPKPNIPTAMLLNASINILHGVWSAGNADTGQHLASPGESLITGGQMLIDSVSQQVTARFETRTGGETENTIRLAGRIEKLGDERFRVGFTNGSTAEFDRLPDGRLLRTSHTGHTLEHELMLVPVRATIHDEDQKQTRLPPILVNTMPKSGSIFIVRCLSQGLGIAETKIAVSLFPDDLIIRDKLDDLALGNQVAQQHLPARDINLRFLRNRLDRMIVHMRDPRQATLSWLHHLDNFHAHRHLEPACERGLEAVSPSLPENYFGRTLSEKIDHLLAIHFPQLIAWTEGWIAADHNKTGPKIRITTFEDFAEDPIAFLRSQLDYFGIADEYFDESKLPRREAQTHFRKGQTDEWKSIFSSAQQGIAREMIPENLSEKFGW